MSEKTSHVDAIGIDEVGRGAWAGPLLVVACKVKSGQKLPKGLTDSKDLSKKKREELFAKIIKVCDVADAWVSADVIDRLGLTDSLKSACILTMMKLDVSINTEVIVDGNIDYLNGTKYKNTKAIVKADMNIPIVSAASIVAKVLRDSAMLQLDSDWPEYGFKNHVGYGTKQHKEALSKYGPCSLHRLSFKPVAESLKSYTATNKIKS